MAINWMDNFNIYGTDAGNAARMLNGVYADTVRTDLPADPDVTATGRVARKFGGGLGGDLRKVLPVARTTVGAAARFWFSNLPAGVGDGQCPTMFSFRDVGNLIHVQITIDPSGNISAYRIDAAGARTLLGTTATPALTANAWKHVESKVLIDNAVGTVEVRVEGITVLNLANVDTFTNQAGAVASIQNVAQQSCQDGAGPVMYIKDYIIWDTTTAFNNNFMGSCQVYKIIPDADVALNWTPSAGGTGFNLINEVTPDDDGSYISAPAPGIPAAYKCSLSDLPVTVTSVRGVMPIHRSRKTDGGDGNIQIGAISGASTGLGVDRPITTAYTYWWDIFDTDPATAAAWSRVSVNAMNLQINRTL
jgi:hypothetical protein